MKSAAAPPPPLNRTVRAGEATDSNNEIICSPREPLSLFEVRYDGKVVAQKRERKIKSIDI